MYQCQLMDNVNAKRRTNIMENPLKHYCTVIMYHAILKETHFIKNENVWYIIVLQSTLLLFSVIHRIINPRNTKMIKLPHESMIQ